MRNFIQRLLASILNADSKYVGEYKDGKKHGQGTFTFTNGTIEEGLFENGRFLGE